MNKFTFNPFKIFSVAAPVKEIIASLEEEGRWEHTTFLNYWSFEDTKTKQVFKFRMIPFSEEEIKFVDKKDWEAFSWYEKTKLLKAFRRKKNNIQTKLVKEKLEEQKNAAHAYREDLIKLYCTPKEAKADSSIEKAGTEAVTNKALFKRLEKSNG